MGPMGFPQTSVRNYHYTLRNIPEERRFHLVRGKSMKLRGCVSLFLPSQHPPFVWFRRRSRTTMINVERNGESS
jgi:hypothetical protein